MTTPEWLPGSVTSAGRHIVASRGQERRLQRVFAQSLVPMLMCDNERRIVEANRAARLLLRASNADLKTLRAEDLTPPHMMQTLNDSWETLARRGQVAGVFDLLLPDGQILRVVWCMMANVLPGLHLAVGMPASWPEDELGVDQDPRSATGGKPRPLTPREAEVLALTASGADLAQIAEELTISPFTAKTHLRNVHRKLGARNRAHAVALAVEHGLLDGLGRD